MWNMQHVLMSLGNKRVAPTRCSRNIKHEALRGLIFIFIFILYKEKVQFQRQHYVQNLYVCLTWSIALLSLRQVRYGFTSHKLINHNNRRLSADRIIPQITSEPVLGVDDISGVTFSDIMFISVPVTYSRLVQKLKGATRKSITI